MLSLYPSRRLVCSISISVPFHFNFCPMLLQFLSHFHPTKPIVLRRISRISSTSSLFAVWSSVYAFWLIRSVRYKDIIYYSMNLLIRRQVGSRMETLKLLRPLADFKWNSSKSTRYLSHSTSVPLHFVFFAYSFFAFCFSLEQFICWDHQHVGSYTASVATGEYRLSLDVSFQHSCPFDFYCIFRYVLFWSGIAVVLSLNSVKLRFQKDLHFIYFLYFTPLGIRIIPSFCKTCCTSK